MTTPLWMKITPGEWEAVKDFWPAECKREPRECEWDDEGTTLKRVIEIRSPHPDCDIRLLVRMAISKAKKEREGSAAVRTAKYLKPLLELSPEEFKAEAVAFGLMDTTDWKPSVASCYRK